MLNYKLQEQIKEIILENQAYLKNLEFFPRELAVLSLSKKPVVITGPRRAGKSTYLGQIRNDLVQKKKVPEHAILPFNFFDERIRPLDTKLLNQIEEAYCQINIDEKISSVYWFLFTYSVISA